MTAHISAKKEDIAKVVLMPGDPLRAKFIAETFLDDYKLVNNVRNMFMYTGHYKGKRITIAGSGMGFASIGIYSHELFAFYDVEKIIRIGTTGSYIKELNLYDVVLVKESMADSTFAKYVLGIDEKSLFPNKELNEEIMKIGKQLNIPIKEAKVHSSEVFYSKLSLEELRKMFPGAECVEMESFALFANAIRNNKKAATLLTVSDNIATKEETSPAERQEAFTKMMEVALELGTK